LSTLGNSLARIYGYSFREYLITFPNRKNSVIL